jgi:prepilin-type N-terminal cleavage/methylation domain-containing protein
MAGFTLVEIMIVVAIIGLLAAIAIPNFVRARTTSQKNACINNLRQYDAAMQQYALENSLASSATYVMNNLTNYVKLTSGGLLPACPAQGTYQQGANVTVSPTCTLSGGTTGHNLP